MQEPVDPVYLSPTSIIDSDHPKVITCARETAGQVQDPIRQSVQIYYFVRDRIWYDPYHPFYLPEHYRASNILAGGRGYCVCKAALLCALGRSLGIPSRLGFADVRNHLATRQLLDFLGSDLFVYHGYTEFYLEGKWVKATPAFNRELCTKHRVPPLPFDGLKDSVFQPYNRDKQEFMEYVADHGTYADVPVGTIVRAWEAAYGKERVRNWIDGFERSEGRSLGRFEEEDVWKLPA